MSDDEKLAEIARLLDEATTHAFENGGGGKICEGAISLHFGDYEDRQVDGLKLQGVAVYSYMLGSSRNNEFGSLDDALGEVRLWHRQEMEGDHA